MVFKSSPRRPGLEKSWASLSPRPKSSKTREGAREKKEEEQEEDQQDLGKARLLSPATLDLQSGGGCARGWHQYGRRGGREGLERGTFLGKVIWAAWWSLVPGLVSSSFLLFYFLFSFFYLLHAAALSSSYSYGVALPRLMLT